MLKYLIFLVFCFFVPRLAHTQVVYRDDGAITDSVELRLLYEESLKILDSTKKAGLNINRLDIVEIGDDKYLLPNGAMSVYKWRNSTWHNICKGANRGFNYGNKAFVHKGKIYSWGGYGFWRGHSMLIVFQEDRGEWELLPFTADLDPMLGWQIPTGLLAFNNKKSIEINIDDKTIKEWPDGFKLDFENTAPLHWYTLDFKDYYLIYTNDVMLVEKATNQKYRTKNAPFKGYVVNGKGMFRIFGDSVTYLNGYTNHILECSVKDELQFFNIVKPSSDKKFYVIFILSLVLFSTILPILIYRKKKQYKIKLDLSADQPHVWSNKYLEALLTHLGQILSADELDTILEIIDIVPAETQRFKRSTLIKEINRIYYIRYNVNLIFRKHDPEDGRKYVYQIGSER